MPGSGRCRTRGGCWTWGHVEVTGPIHRLGLGGSAVEIDGDNGALVQPGPAVPVNVGRACRVAVVCWDVSASGAAVIG